MPAHPHALARFPLGDPGADRIHRPDHFMAGNARILNTRPMAFLDQRVTMANATGLDLDPHLAGAGLRNFTFNQFKRPAGPGDLGSTHFWHNHLQFFYPRNEDAGESGTFFSNDNPKRAGVALRPPEELTARAFGEMLSRPNDEGKFLEFDSAAPA
jgi:hypothetical protein